MNNNHIETQEPSTVSPLPLVKKEQGLFNCSTINCMPEEVFNFFQDQANVEKILTDFPIGLKNFLNLELKGSEHNAAGFYEVTFENKVHSTESGTLTLTFEAAIQNKGTALVAEAIFDGVKLKDEKNSLIMNTFLRRMKSLLETGEIPTTKGQPSGRKEIPSLKKTTLH